MQTIKGIVHNSKNITRFKVHEQIRLALRIVEAILLLLLLISSWKISAQLVSEYNHINQTMERLDNSVGVLGSKIEVIEQEHNKLKEEKKEEKPAEETKPVSIAPTAMRKVEATAYNSCEAQTDNSPCIAANGENICDGYNKGNQYVAYNDAKIGTKVKLGDVNYTVVDRSGKQGIIDIYFGPCTPENVQSALNFGRKDVTIQIL